MDFKNNLFEFVISYFFSLSNCNYVSPIIMNLNLKIDVVKFIGTYGKKMKKREKWIGMLFANKY